MWRNRFHVMPGFIAVVWGLLNGGFFPFITDHSRPDITEALNAAAPVADCEPIQTLTLNANGQKSLLAVQLDGDSYDPGGGFLWFKARRVIPGDCGTDTLFRSSVNFCCTDVGDTIDVILRVYNVPVDTGGVSAQYALANSNDCIAKVVVTETVKPQIATLANDTVSCEFFLSGIIFPPVVTDNCCIDTILKSDQFITYDTSCKRGVVRRRFTAVDCAGNTATSTQTLTVQNDQFYVVEFPADVITTGCTDLSSNALGTPVVYEGSCEKMNLTFIDTFQYNSQSGGLPCLLIYRTWRVFNWCQYSASIPLTNIPNPNPEPFQFSPSNLPGPVVGPAGIASVIKITPNDPAPTDFSMFWSQFVNGFTYKQIIRIYDQELPKGRIASPSGFCDQSINDPNLWQGGNWYDPQHSSNDLLECPALLTLRATDNCSFNDMSVYFELYLDLDNDGAEETLINSQSPPPSGSVMFGNLLPGGGEQRQFDRRIVGINQKYNFALERVITGDSMTARVKWNTMLAPATYFTPQFPYGHHRLVWHLFDKCGNEQVFIHLFTTSDDCEAPVITCVPDITVSITNPGDSLLVTTDELVYNVSDNVTQEADILVSMEKMPFGNVFPGNGMGSPVYGLYFTCAEIGFQPVRLWARDEFGNTAFCESIVVVDDPESVCTVFSPAVSGTATTVQGAQMNVDFDLYEMPDTIFQGTSNNGALGFYYFNNLTPLGNYFIRPRIDSSDLLNGVNTYDLVLISRHILNLEPLNSPFKLIGADVNRSGTVTTFDIVTARKAILGTLLEFPGNQSWRMIPKSFQFVDPQNPFLTVFPEQINLSSVFEVVNDADFYCVKVGDVDLTASPNHLQSTEERDLPTGLVLETGTPVNHGNYTEIPLLATAQMPLEGFQMELAWPENSLISVDFQSNILSPDHYVVRNNSLRMSWEFPVSTFHQKITLGSFKIKNTAADLFEQFTVRNNGTFKSAAYGQGGIPQAVVFNSQSGFMPDAGVSLSPNPFSDELRIDCNLSRASSVKVDIRDVHGRIIYQTETAAPKGWYSFKQYTTNWHTGVYICRIETVDGIFISKPIKF